MNKLIKSKKSINVALATFGVSAMLFSMPAFASNEATLSGIEINSYNGNSYNIILKTNKTIPVEKEITNDNKIILNLKNVKPEGFINTIYNNTNQVNNVIIRTVSENEVNIYIDGTNIASSMIKLAPIDSIRTASANKDPIDLADQASKNVKSNTTNIPNNNNQEAATPLPKSITDNNNNNIDSTQDTNTVIIKPAITSFKPLANSDESNLNESPLDMLKNSTKLMAVLKFITGSTPKGWSLRFLTLIFLVIIGFKLLKPRKKTVKVDFYNDTRNRELELLKELNNRKSPIIPNSKEKSQPSYNRINSEFNVRSRYGLQEYQNSQTPYSKTTSKKPITNIDKNIGLTKLKNETSFNSIQSKSYINSQKTPKSTTALNTSKITNKDINNAKVNINGVKFLENMAKIYEKSGRGDLAQGIQNNISRTSISLR